MFTIRFLGTLGMVSVPNKAGTPICVAYCSDQKPEFVAHVDGIAEFGKQYCRRVATCAERMRANVLQTNE